MTFDIDSTDEELAMALYFINLFPEAANRGWKRTVKPSTVWRGCATRQHWYRQARLLRATLLAAGNNTRVVEESRSVFAVNDMEAS